MERDATHPVRPSRPHRPEADEALRRAVNIVVAAVGLVVAAPLMVLTAVLVKLDSPGPVIYRQPRVGIDRRRRGGGCRRAEGHTHERRRTERRSSERTRRDDDLGGRVFTIYKFRTMTVSDDARQKWASRDDARVTRVGRVLRSTRIDELPQLVNVLKGDMNVVGPRPEQPTIFTELREQVDDYPSRQQVLPGITGLAQIQLGYDTSLDGVREKVRLDLDYIRDRSVMRDVALMAKTMPVMLFRRVWM